MLCWVVLRVLIHLLLFFGSRSASTGRHSVHFSSASFKGGVSIRPQGHSSCHPKPMLLARAMQVMNDRRTGLLLSFTTRIVYKPMLCRPYPTSRTRTFKEPSPVSSVGLSNLPTPCPTNTPPSTPRTKGANLPDPRPPNPPAIPTAVAPSARRSSSRPALAPPPGGWPAPVSSSPRPPPLLSRASGTPIAAPGAARCRPRRSPPARG